MVPLVKEAADFGSRVPCVTMCCETASADATVIAMGTSLRVWRRALCFWIGEAGIGLASSRIADERHCIVLCSAFCCSLLCTEPALSSQSLQQDSWSECYQMLRDVGS